jgi:hypothetical protein
MTTPRIHYVQREGRVSTLRGKCIAGKTSELGQDPIACHDMARIGVSIKKENTSLHDFGRDVGVRVRFIRGFR